MKSRAGRLCLRTLRTSAAPRPSQRPKALRVRSKPVEANFLTSGVKVSDAMPIGCPGSSFCNSGVSADHRWILWLMKSTKARGTETGTQPVSRLGRPALRTNCVAQPQLARRPLHALLHTETSASLDAHSQQRQFLRAQRCIHSIDPIHLAFHRPRRKDSLDRIIPMIPRPQAAPTPVLRSRNQPCTYCPPGAFRAALGMGGS